MDFKDKIALVTGGTSGIGKKIAEELLKQGSKVIINYGHDDIQAQKTKQELDNYKNNIVLIKADLSNLEEVKLMFEEVKNKYGKLDYLVNNAGTNVDSYIENFNIEDWNKVLNVNLTGKFLCTKYAIPLLKKSKSAAIVNIASRLGTRPCKEASAYCVAESGIINFTKCSALELSEQGIRVNTVSPGLTITPLSLNGWTEKEIEETKNSNPLKRLGETIDIANAVLFLLSDDASYITGQNINVNRGGLL
ncbi:MAG: SDR family NAD(P)-dependent oxidoreductase [Bacilli bacterium]|nr:SDR family NAD(P)-dependent oxidoreductase [Bacilli bacterium]